MRKSPKKLSKHWSLFHFESRKGSRIIVRAFDDARLREFGYERLHTWQAQRLSQLLRHCTNYVSAYQRNREKINEINESNAHNTLSSFPIVTKEDLACRVSAYISTQSKPGSLRAINSSGASGQRTFILRPKTAAIDNSVVLRRIYSSTELCRKITILYLIAGWQDAVYSHSDDHGHINYIKIGVERLLSNPFQLDKLSPTGIFGSPLFLLAISQVWTPIKKSINPVYMFSSFEHLPDDIRHKIEYTGFFKVRDIYAASEITTPMAFECEKGKIHVNADYCILEVVDDTGKPVEISDHGYVLVTDLCNFAMPIVRYSLGDIVTLDDGSHCACGRALPTIARIQGRGNHLILPNGDFACSEPICHSIRTILSKPFTLVQEDFTRFTLIIYEAKCDDDLASQIKQVLTKFGFAGTELALDVRNASSEFMFAKHLWFLSRAPRIENRLSL